MTVNVFALTVGKPQVVTAVQATAKQQAAKTRIFRLITLMDENQDGKRQYKLDGWRSTRKRSGHGIKYIRQGLRLRRASRFW